MMRLAEKSPLWNWYDVINWLFLNKIIKDKELVENAFFFSNINAALEESDRSIREVRHNLLKKISQETEQF